jgi:DNA-binding NtrC family response regulator
MGPSVLVVDDDGAALASARVVLNEAGYAVTAAQNGRQALQRIMANPPDLLITGIFMQEVDGIELIAAVKRSHPAVRIIVVSDRRFMGALDLFDLASKLGADTELAKPLDSGTLLAAVTDLLGSVRGRG